MMSLRLSVLLSLALSACSSLQVTSDYDPEVDFSRGFERYAWRPAEEMRSNGVTDELTDKLLRDAIDAEMAARGFQKVTGEPEFLIGYHAAVDQEIGFRPTSTTGFVVGPHWTYGSTMYYGTSEQPYVYEKGTLILDFLKDGGKRLVWRGIASARVDRTASREERMERAREAAAEMLAQFPPEQDRSR